MKKPLSKSTLRRKKFQQRNISVALQPFKLVKYFSFTSLFVILFASFVLSWTISNNAKKVLLERSEAYSLLFAENLNKQVFLQFVLPTVLRYGHIALSNNTQFRRLDSIVNNITEGMKIDSLIIFDSGENIVSYSTEIELVGKKNLGGLEYKKALKGDNNSILISSGSLFNLLPGAPPFYCKLKTYIPFRQEDKFGKRSGNIMGVIEVVQDLSEDLKAIIKLQGEIIILSLSIMVLLLIVLSIIVARGSRIIEARARERSRLEEKLHEAERLASLGKMVASVSHEIKNPLGIIRSTAEILGKRISKVAPGNEHLASIIVEETSRLNNIVTEFLDFARPSDPKMISTSLNSLVERVNVFMEPEFTTKSISSVLKLDPSIPEIKMDGEKIYQVLLNIVVNAVQAMEGGGSLTIETQGGHDSTVGIIKITDSGPGMSKEKIEQIFKPFFTDKNRGSGLGLAIAKKIIEKHDGEIRVASKENFGSTFTFSVGGPL